ASQRVTKATRIANEVDRRVWNRQTISAQRALIRLEAGRRLRRNPEALCEGILDEAASEVLHTPLERVESNREMIVLGKDPAVPFGQDAEIQTRNRSQRERGDRRRKIDLDGRRNGPWLRNVERPVDGAVR